MATAPTSDYPAQFDVEYTEARNRVTVLFRLILAIPILILSSLVTAAVQNLSFGVTLMLLFVAVAVVLLLAWFIILITGRFPRGMFNFVVGTMRWTWRVNAYALLLSTDRYPPFSLK